MLRERILVNPAPAPFLPRIRLPSRLVLYYFNGQYHPGLAYFRHVRVLRKMRARRTHVRRQGEIARNNLVVLEDIQGGEGRGTGQRVAGVLCECRNALCSVYSA